MLIRNTVQNLGSEPRDSMLMTTSHVWTLARQMDFSLVPVAHGEGQHVGCSNVSSIPGGRGSSIHLTGTTVSAGVPKEMPQTTFRRHSDLAAECAPVLGLSTYCPQAAFIRSFMTSLGCEDTLPKYRQRREGLWSHHLDSKFG